MGLQSVVEEVVLVIGCEVLYCDILLVDTVCTLSLVILYIPVLPAYTIYTRAKMVSSYHCEIIMVL